MNKISFELITMKSEMWIDIVLLQIERILEANKKLYNLTDSEKLMKDNWIINTQRTGDEHFLKVAMLKTIEWLSELSKYAEVQELNDEDEETEDERENKWLDELWKYYRDIKTLRPIAEHEIEYYKDGGDYKNKFVNKDNGLSALETGKTEDDYLIGGRLSLNTMKIVFCGLKDKISKHQFVMKMTYILEMDKLI